MAEYHLIADRAGERADAFLARSIEGLTRSAAQRLLEEGAAVCGGKTWKKNSNTVPGDEVTVGGATVFVLSVDEMAKY